MRNRILTRFLLLFMLALPVAGWAQQTTGVNFFHGTFAELQDKARKTGKPYFIDCYTTWCGPCKMLNKTTFVDKTVGEFANSNYIPYKLDCEGGEGPTLCRQFRVQGYPSILFFDANGKQIGLVYGYVDAATFLEEMKKFLPQRKSQGSRGNDNTPSFNPEQRIIQKREKLVVEEQQLLKTTWSAWAPTLQKADSLARVRDELGFETLTRKIGKEVQLSTLVNLWYQRGRGDMEAFAKLADQALEANLLDANTQLWAAGQFIAVEDVPPVAMRLVNAYLRTSPTYAGYEMKALLCVQCGKVELGLEAARAAEKLEKSEENARLTAYLKSRTQD
jgi:thioredoxin 1